MRYACLVVLYSGAVFAQNAAPAFDVATVKLAPGGSADIRILPGGRLTITDLRLTDIISQAYGVKHYQISGGPAWLGTDRFDISTKAEGDPNRDRMLRMLQTLLEDRFQLKVHRETKEGAVYALTVTKNGANLPQAAPLKDGERAIVVSGRHASLAMLAASLEGSLSRPVLDQTGIKGDFDFRFEYAADETNPGDFPSLFTALQETLGLKLESTKGPVETLAVDRVEKPSGN